MKITICWDDQEKEVLNKFKAWLWKESQFARGENAFEFIQAFSPEALNDYFTTWCKNIGHKPRIKLN